jgi:hypothetical protein
MIECVMVSNLESDELLVRRGKGGIPFETHEALSRKKVDVRMPSEMRYRSDFDELVVRMFVGKKNRRSTERKRDEGLLRTSRRTPDEH